MASEGWRVEHEDMGKTDGQRGLHESWCTSIYAMLILAQGNNKEGSWWEGFITLLYYLCLYSEIFCILVTVKYTVLTRSQPCVSSFLDLVTSFQQLGWNILEQTYWEKNEKYWFAECSVQHMTLLHQHQNCWMFNVNSNPEHKLMSIAAKPQLNS